MTPERAATLEELREIRVALEDTNRLMARQVKDEVAAASVPREEFNRRIRRSGQRVALGLVTVLAIAAFLVAFNRATLQQAQQQAADDIRTLITTCRTTTPTISPADLAYCNGRIPGFSEARKRATEAAATAKRNVDRLDRLEREVARLRR